MEFVFADHTAWVGVNGRTVQVIEGEAWYAQDPVVLRHPALFTSEPKIVRGTRPVKAVEQATAAPGEKRTRTRRD